MAYKRTNWKSGAEGGTLVTDERLNNIEDGIQQALAGIPPLVIPTTDVVMTAVAGDPTTQFAILQNATFAAQVVVSGFAQAAIQTAIGKLPADGGHLHFPRSPFGSGVPYVLTAGLQFNGLSNLTISGDGVKVIADAAWADTKYDQYPNYAFDSLFRFVRCLGVDMSGVSVDGNLTNRAALAGVESFNSNIFLAGSENVRIHDCTITGGMTDNITVGVYGATNGANTYLSRGVRIWNCTISGARRNNISLIGHDGLWISHCTIFDPGTVKGISPKANIQCEPDYAGVSKNLFVLHNEIYGAPGTYSVSLSGKATTTALIEGNTIRDNVNNGLNVSSLAATPTNTGVIVRGNKLLRNGEAGMTTSRDNVDLIMGNVFAGNKYGINSVIAGVNVLNDNVFTGNTYQGAVFAAFVDVHMAGNRFEDNASAQGLVDGAGFAVYATPADSTAVFTADVNSLSNAPAATSLMKGIYVTAACNARGNGNTGKNLGAANLLLRGLSGAGNYSFDAFDRTRGAAGDQNYDDNLQGGGRLYIGSKVHYAALAAPTTGTWEKGDVVHNLAPALGKPAMWVCLTNGTPGYWQPVVVMSGAGATRGDSDATVTAGVDGELVQYTTTLTANRTLTLAGGYDGAKFRVRRTAAGAFTLSVGGIKTLAQNQWVDVVSNGSTWMVTAFGSL